MVLLGRIELPTSPLPRVRSTTELQQQRAKRRGGTGQARAIVAALHNVKQGLNTIALNGKALQMNEPPRNKITQATTREERLAAQLRENLRKRKAQGRAISRQASETENESGAQMLPKPTDEG